MKTIETHYCPDADITYLMEITYTEDGDLDKMKVLSFYCGEPDEQVTQYYIENPSTEATF
jgi:hypothetical protein